MGLDTPHICEANSNNHDHLALGSASTKKPKIAIIGAGLSGLTIGYRLNQKGYDISLYEARSCVGGRVHTVYVKNIEGTYSIAELGGQNITDGGEAKHFLNLAHELGLEIEDDYRCLSRGFYADGKMYDINELLKTCGFSEHKLEQTLKAISLSAVSIRDVIEHLFSDNSLLKRIFNFYMGAYEGLPAEDLAINPNIETLKYFLPGGIAAPQEVAGTDNPFLLKYIKGGNSKLPLALADALEGKIFLNKVLQKVSYGDEKIKLSFNDNTTVLCDKLILSIPCSTFKDILWEDSVIPKEQLDAFYDVQYGSNGKILIPVESNRIDSHYSLVSNDHVGTFHNNDYTLLTLYIDSIWGSNLNENFKSYYAEMIEMVEANYGKIKKSLPHPIVPSEKIYQQYDEPIIKSWAEDVYAKGSYSAIGTKLGDTFLNQSISNNIPVKTIFLPIYNKIFFIGEHASLIGSCDISPLKFR